MLIYFRRRSRTYWIAFFHFRLWFLLTKKKNYAVLAGTELILYFLKTLKTTPGHTDPELVALLKKKDPDAIVFLFEKYAGPLYGLVNQVMANTSVVNETFVEVFLKITGSIDQHDPAKSRLFTWMLKITREVSIEKLKGISSRIYSEGGLQEPGVKVVGGLISSLQTDEQEVIGLTYLKGYSIEEVAGKLDIPAEIVRARMNKALIAINSQVRK